VYERQNQVIDEDCLEEEKEELVIQRVKVQVEIKKVVNQEKFAVEFTRKAGPLRLFYSEVKKYRAEVNACNDTLLVN